MLDGELVAMVLGGDIEAYGQLVTRYSGQMYRYALSITGDHHRAEEAVEDSFSDCFLHLRSLSNPDAFGGWLTTTVRRRCWRVRCHAADEDISELAEVVKSDMWQQPDEHFERCENIGRVRAALNRLSPGQRDVALLFYLDDCSVRETAQRLSLPEGTVKRRLFEARQKLRKELRDMNMKNIDTTGLEQRIRQRINELLYYKRIHKAYDPSYYSQLKDIEALIGQLPDPTRRQYYMTDTLLLSARGDGDDALKKQARECADDSGNLTFIRSDLLDKYFSKLSGESRLKYIENTALPELEKYKDSPDYDSVRGELICWRGWSKINNDIDAARADFELAGHLIYRDRAMNAVARAAVRAIDLNLKHAAFPESGIVAVGEQLVKNGQRLVFTAQPGITRGKHGDLKFASLFYWASRVDYIMFDAGMSAGEHFTAANGSTFTCVSCDEAVSAPAGDYDGCVHYRGDVVDGRRGIPYSFDTWYKNGIGLVRVLFSEQDGITEEYLLSDGRIQGGSGLLPLAEGNRWVYTVGSGVPDYAYYHIERHVTYAEGNIGICAGTNLLSLRREIFDDDMSDKIGSDGYVIACEALCNRWRIDEAIKMLRAAVRVNSSADAVNAALEGIDTLTRFSDYYKRGYRFCPSSVHSTCIIVSDENVYQTGENYCFAPYQFGKRGRYEDRIFGLKPLRYLTLLAGCLWNHEWKPGYTVRRTVPELEDNAVADISVTEGGSVTVPCGTFDNCLKLTINVELNGMERDYYFRDRYAYMWCGRKEFWFAPGVGIVRHVCTWGDVISSEAVLTDCRVPASDGREYFPVHIGTHWEYEETHLAAEGYRASRIYNVRSGVGGHYDVTTAQEFVYLGSEDEYEKLPRMIKLK